MIADEQLGEESVWAALRSGREGGSLRVFYFVVEDEDDDGVGSLQSCKFVVTGSLWLRGLVRGRNVSLGVK